MDRSHMHRSIGATTKAVLWCGLGLVYGYAALGGCAQGGGPLGAEETSSTGASTSAGTGLSTGSGPTGSGSNGAGTSGDSTSGVTSGGSTSGTPQTSGDCCVGSTTPGCSDTAVEQCVCAADDYCCTTEWN